MLLSSLAPVVHSRLTQSVSIAIPLLEGQPVPLGRLFRQHFETYSAQPARRSLIIHLKKKLKTDPENRISFTNPQKYVIEM